MLVMCLLTSCWHSRFGVMMGKTSLLGRRLHGHKDRSAGDDDLVLRIESGDARVLGERWASSLLIAADPDPFALVERAVAAAAALSGGSVRGVRRCGHCLGRLQGWLYRTEKNSNNNNNVILKGNEEAKFVRLIVCYVVLGFLVRHMLRILWILLDAHLLFRLLDEIRQLSAWQLQAAVSSIRHGLLMSI